jgi:hypothetical protein
VFSWFETQARSKPKIPTPEKTKYLKLSLKSLMAILRETSIGANWIGEEEKRGYVALKNDRNKTFS